LKNRIVVSPMATYSAVDGVPQDFHLVHLGARALGGAALVFVEMTAPCAEGRITPGCPGLWNETQAKAFKRIVDFVHASGAGAKIGMQLGHSGPKGSTQVGWEQPDEPLHRQLAAAGGQRRGLRPDQPDSASDDARRHGPREGGVCAVHPLCGRGRL
jgi:2,4-dienoyl-CoA reductase-like NADH-dependent reductase (Old Yellow Enzyme family)